VARESRPKGPAGAMRPSTDFFGSTAIRLSCATAVPGILAACIPDSVLIAASESPPLPPGARSAGQTLTPSDGSVPRPSPGASRLDSWLAGAHALRYRYETGIARRSGRRASRLPPVWHRIRPPSARRQGPRRPGSGRHTPSAACSGAYAGGWVLRRPSRISGGRLPGGRALERPGGVDLFPENRMRLHLHAGVGKHLRDLGRRLEEIEERLLV
jgi:hypothetical protein